MASRHVFSDLLTLGTSTMSNRPGSASNSRTLATISQRCLGSGKEHRTKASTATWKPPAGNCTRLPSPSVTGSDPLGPTASCRKSQRATSGCEGCRSRARVSNSLKGAKSEPPLPTSNKRQGRPDWCLCIAPASANASFSGSSPICLAARRPARAAPPPEKKSVHCFRHHSTPAHFHGFVAISDTACAYCRPSSECDEAGAPCLILV
mmetsp:Transcript_89114/g.191218  ORF Transcript_89114/g.191218 Transcript_89114/m.191218 type:complete len:207 (-) Transcript_89114:572-1192(-)